MREGVEGAFGMKTFVLQSADPDLASNVEGVLFSDGQVACCRDSLIFMFETMLAMKDWMADQTPTLMMVLGQEETEKMLAKEERP